jgi:hypothetical protein
MLFREITVPPPYTIELMVYNGTEYLHGCHPYRMSLELKSGTNWWDCGRGHVFFRPDGEIWLYDKVGWHYDELEWVKVRMDYIRVDATTVHVRYHIDDELLFETDLGAVACENILCYIAPGAQEGTAWIDDVCISRFTPQLDVFIDIKPGSCPNPLNTGSKGVLPVAALGMADFDVREIDVSSVTLEGVEPLRWNYEDVATPFPGELCDCWTEGPDGYDDLTLKFDNQEILDALGEVQDGDKIELTLTGNLLDGTEMTGSDCVVIIDRGEGGEQSKANSLGYFPTLALAQNTPNPFARSTLIAFNIPSAGHISLKVYDACGSLVEILVSEELSPGRHTESWDRGNLDSGVYFCELNAGGLTLTRKMVVVR